MPKRIAVFLGHPDSDSYCAHLAHTYAEAARAAGHDAELIKLGELHFDPILRRGHKQEQPLEPDLQMAQQAIAAADHLVFAYPIWWGAMPALLKGFFDRCLLPGFAFKYRDGGARIDKLLSGRSAELLVTLDTPYWYYRWFQRMPGQHQMKRTILEFCGIQPVRAHHFGPIIHATDEQRTRWTDQVAKLAGSPAAAARYAA